MAADQAATPHATNPPTRAGTAAINAPIWIAAKPPAIMASAIPTAIAGALPCWNQPTILPIPSATPPITPPIVCRAPARSLPIVTANCWKPGLETRSPSFCRPCFAISKSGPVNDRIAALALSFTVDSCPLNVCACAAMPPPNILCIPSDTALIA